MRFYPDIPHQRATTIAKDVLLVALILLFAWLALRVHDTVEQLQVLGEGVSATGRSVNTGFQTAADAVDDAPLVGDAIGAALEDAGEASGGEIDELGQSGQDRVHELANLLAMLTFLLPTGLLLLWVLPSRINLVRRLTAAEQVLRDPNDVERRRVVAMRAAFSLPYGQLLEHTKDPLGDLAAERYDPLVAAALDDAGLRAPATAS